MRRLALCLALALPLALTYAPDASADDDTKPINCGNCATWNAPRAPFKLAPHSWYVGVNELAAVLIDTGQGLILLDGGLPQSVAPITTNIAQLGFDIANVKYIGLSHPHFDHAGGVAALARLSGAAVVTSQRGAEILALGHAPPDDAQYTPDNPMNFPPVKNALPIADGATLTLGKITLTMHETPAHAPGGTTWTWRDCDASGEHCVDLVYADRLNPVAADTFRFGDQPEHVKQFRATVARVRALPCDVLVSAHPSFSQLFERETAGQLVDTEACKRYADAADARLDARTATERGAAK